MRNVVPFDSPLFRLARRADIDGVKALFQSGQASPFDVNEFGYNPLEVSSVWQWRSRAFQRYL